MVNRSPLAGGAAALPRPFRPSWWAAGPHGQTLAGKFLRRPSSIVLSRERWVTPDGDFLDLDRTPDPDPRAPLVVVLHGLEGSARRGYCLETYRALRAQGIAAVGLNFRSCSGEPNRRARAYHSGETGDTRWVLEQLRARYPMRPFGAVGFSLGGNVLLKLLGEGTDGGVGLLQAAVAISVPYDLGAGADHLNRNTMGRIYTHYFLRSLLAKARDKAHLLEERFDLRALARARTLRAFDELLTAPLHGFRSAEHYYRESSAAGYLEGVRVPTLLLHSADDPFLPSASLPLEAIGGNRHLRLVLTARGGHVGFVTGAPWRPRFWGEDSAARFLARALASA
jgi:uncharacterized protein